MDNKYVRILYYITWYICICILPFLLFWTPLPFSISDKIFFTFPNNTFIESLLLTLCIYTPLKLLQIFLLYGYASFVTKFENFNNDILTKYLRPLYIFIILVGLDIIIVKWGLHHNVNKPESAFLFSVWEFLQYFSLSINFIIMYIFLLNNFIKKAESEIKDLLVEQYKINKNFNNQK